MVNRLSSRVFNIMSTFAEILNSDTPTLVDFSAVWCGPCKMMEPILKELSGNVGEKVRIVKVDIDKNPAVAQQYNVMAVPTLILFKKGENKWRESGIVPASRLQQLIEAL